MPELRGVSGQQAIKALERLGFKLVRQRGSHVILKKSTPAGNIGCAVPLHKELKIGTGRDHRRPPCLVPLHECHAYSRNGEVDRDQWEHHQPGLPMAGSWSRGHMLIILACSSSWESYRCLGSS